MNKIRKVTGIICPSYYLPIHSKTSFKKTQLLFDIFILFRQHRVNSKITKPDSGKNTKRVFLQKTVLNAVIKIFGKFARKHRLLIVNFLYKKLTAYLFMKIQKGKLRHRGFIGIFLGQLICRTPVIIASEKKIICEKRIQNPAKYMRWSFLQKQLTAESR